MESNIGYQSNRQATKGDAKKIMGGKFALAAYNAKEVRKAQGKRGKYPITEVPAGCKQSANYFSLDRCGGSSCCIGCRHKPTQKRV